MVGLKKYFANPVLISTLICIFLFYSGSIKIPDRSPYISLNPLNNVTEIQGKIVNSPVKSKNGKFYNCTIELISTSSISGISSSARGKIQVSIPSEMVEAYFPGKIYSSIKNKKVALFESGGIYSFRGNVSKSVFYVTHCLSSKWDNTLYGKIDKFRALCRLQFKRLLFAWGEAGGLLLALLCGAKEYTNQIVSDNFRKSGLSHILALSGMHLSMFSSIAMFFGGKLGRKKLSFLIRIIVLILFVWFAGLSPSLLRAYICAMLTLLASMAGSKQPDMILILCFSFLIQCIISPGDIHNTGFILSYSALAGILLLNKLFFKIYIKLIPEKISGSLSASTAAQVFTAPISLKIFGSFSPIGIVATAIVSPLVTIFIYTGLILIIMSLLFPLFADCSAIIINFMYNIIKFFVNIFSKVPNLES